MIVKIDAPSLAAAAVPLELQPPLLVDADRVKPRQIAVQLLEMIAGWHAQVLIGRRVVDHLELAKEAAFEVGRDFPGMNIFHEKGPQPVLRARFRRGRSGDERIRRQHGVMQTVSQHRRKVS